MKISTTASVTVETQSRYTSNIYKYIFKVHAVVYATSNSEVTVHLSELYNNEDMDVDYLAGHSNMMSW